MQNLRIYRVYKLTPESRMILGDWIEAADDEHAKRLARIMCDIATPSAEIWYGPNLIGRVSGDFSARPLAPAALGLDDAGR